MTTASSSTPRVLLLGGHGKVSLLLTPLLLARSWHVTSLIRNSDSSEQHEAEIRDIAKKHGYSPAQLDIVSDESLEDVKSEQDALRVLERTKPDYVVWSAGAGGKGGPERTFAIDRDAAKAYISASCSPNSGVRKFLMISYLGSRRCRPSWWTDDDWSSSLEVNNGALKNYFQAKVEADEWLVSNAHKRNDAGAGAKFQAINLRPGSLTDDRGTGEVSLGHTKARGKVTREDVAQVAVRLLERDDTNGWYDLLEGEEPIQQAVDRVVKEGIDCFEGEDTERIYSLAK